MVRLSGSAFRPGTDFPVTPLSIVMCGEGLGGYVCYVRALQWVAENCPHLRVTLYVAPFFYELAKHWLSPYPHWEVCFHDDIRTKYKKDSPALAPDYPVRDQSHNALGAHPLDIGFANYANIGTGAPAGYNDYPGLNFPKDAIPKILRGTRYAVLTPGATAPNRALRPEHWEFLIDEVLRRDLTPVFLGKADLTTNYGGKFPRISYDKGIDLRERTSPLEAAAIMQHAAFTLGLDNGLLHLASCTPGAVIFGYNIASVAHREPRRRSGILKNIFLTKAELSCNFCQSEMKLLISHDYKNCLYKDNRCIDLLFSEGIRRRWTEAMDGILCQV